MAISTQSDIVRPIFCIMNRFIQMCYEFLLQIVAMWVYFSKM